MPLSFAIVPGLAGNLMVLARGDHLYVTATGPCVILAAWIPEFRAVPGPGANSFVLHFWQISWLLLIIVPPCAELGPRRTPRARRGPCQPAWSCAGSLHRRWLGCLPLFTVGRAKAIAGNCFGVHGVR